MSTASAPIQDCRAAGLDRNLAAEQIDLAAKSSANTPNRLLWSTGIIALVLGIVAFVLWGVNGAGTLFDMVVALCG